MRIEPNRVILSDIIRGDRNIDDKYLEKNLHCNMDKCIDKKWNEFYQTTLMLSNDFDVILFVPLIAKYRTHTHTISHNLFHSLCVIHSILLHTKLYIFMLHRKLIKNPCGLIQQRLYSYTIVSRTGGKIRLNVSREKQQKEATHSHAPPTVATCRPCTYIRGPI